MLLVTTMDVTRAVVIPCAQARVGADLVVPASARGLVIVAGAGSIVRASPDARAFVDQLRRRAEVATLWLDLLSPAEGLDTDTAHLRAQVPLLAQRLAAATEWAQLDADTRHMHVGYLSSGAGAAAALHAASSRTDVRAIVSRAGRPDLAGAALESVHAPTLLLVCDDDDALVGINRSARTRLHATTELAIIPGKSVEAIDDMGRRAGAWLARHLA